MMANDYDIHKDVLSVRLLTNANSKLLVNFAISNGPKYSHGNNLNGPKQILRLKASIDR
jgi:hypothetical protein